MKEFKPNKETPPNPAKLMESLRHTGYDNYNALADIIDNSIDADAENVWVEIHKEREDFVISIIDDGIGMNEEVLAESLKLGSDIEKNIETDLGKFGMGLCTAGLSMSRRTTVLTKQKEEALLVGINDLDWVIEHRQFRSYVAKADDEEKARFEDLTEGSPHGTIVTFSKSDKIQNPNVTNFANHLKKDMGRIFKRFIEADKKFYVNGELVSAIDPLMLSEPKTHLYSDEEYSIKIEVSNGKTTEDNIRIRMVLLPDFGFEGNRDKGVNLFNQGFYVMRNERELFAGQSLDIFTKDPHLNRFRAEICFSGALDELMGVHFTKRSLSMSQGLKDKLKEITRSQINQLRNMADSERPRAEKEVSHTNVEKLISKKSKLLIKPPAGETIKEKEEKQKKVKKPEIKHPEQVAHDRLRLICRFEESRMDKVGPLFYPYMEGAKVIIRWNVEHPFYERVLVVKKEDKTFLTAIDFLIYSLASAELKSRSDENISLLESIRGNMSTNLRVLLD